MSEWKIGDIINNIYNIFWTSEQRIPKKDILLILIIFHIFITGFSFISYKLIINKIKKSSKILNLLEPISIKRSFTLFFSGLILIEFNNIASHLSGYLFPEKRSYLFIGNKAIFYYIGFIIFFTGLNLLFANIFEIPRTMKLQLKKVQSFIIGLNFIIFLIILFTGIFLLSNYYVIISLFLLIVFHLFTVRNACSNILIMNPVLKKRFLLFNAQIFLIEAFSFSSIFFIARLKNNAVIHPLHTPLVEYQIFIMDLFVLISTLLMLWFVFLPQYIRRIIKLTDGDFQLYRNDYLDFNYQPILDFDDKIFNLDLVSSSKIENNLNKDSIVIYSKNDCEEAELHQLLNIFKTDEIIEQNSLSEGFVNDFVLPKKNLIFLWFSFEALNQDILAQIQQKDDFDIELEDNLIVNNYEYNSEKSEFGLVYITNSVFNKKKKLWLIISPLKLKSIIIEFILKYFRYLDFISNYNEERENQDIPICMVIRFPVINGEIQNVPPNSTGNAPESRNLIFL